LLVPPPPMFCNQFLLRGRSLLPNKSFFFSQKVRPQPFLFFPFERKVFHVSLVFPPPVLQTPPFLCGSLFRPYGLFFLGGFFSSPVHPFSPLSPHGPDLLSWPSWFPGFPAAFSPFGTGDHSLHSVFFFFFFLKNNRLFRWKPPTPPQTLSYLKREILSLLDVFHLFFFFFSDNSIVFCPFDGKGRFLIGEPRFLKI